ncbi:MULTISPECIES: PIG-L deacetylase family protein [Sporomusa]|uniref:Glucosamine-6-phosphate deaminase-like protein n=1 Tax=Sporomusa sphaeroides DSM 2875 TaxID=1337886 RepID=A0ABM9W9X4_9FIRM|nr:PIG-L family deacetylase [Sporomusa sphaeroides]OLS55579.1 1D-myo-inositol 2-acetamido-2-deoxy-alpha-D-glucopyranoside deacetylase [Sporomusa sphaeroides DSM 2875]CVK21897.1 glucosamine-6-phosphate deaminase-like protein [Sporomusa sphaeroides DSM 2875]
MKKNKKILIVAAHPDDEILGCGGTIIKHVLNGDEVHVLIMAEGLTSRDVRRDVSLRNKELSQLYANTYQAAKIMGVKSLKICDFPDNRMDGVELLDVVKKVEEMVETIKPDMVYTHHAGDVNVDHTVTHNAVITACRPLPGQTVKTILFFETLSSTEWQIGTCDKIFMANWFVDIEATFAKKMEALKCYDSEMREYPHSRSYESVEILAKYRGTVIGCQFAEAFSLGRLIS